jgi:hypothetical protein
VGVNRLVTGSLTAALTVSATICFQIRVGVGASLAVLTTLTG